MPQDLAQGGCHYVFGEVCRFSTERFSSQESALLQHLLDSGNLTEP